jgi:hypothetical protein
VWLNPPYRADLIGRFVRKLLDELEAGNVTEAGAAGARPDGRGLVPRGRRRRRRGLLHAGPHPVRDAGRAGGQPDHRLGVPLLRRPAREVRAVFGAAGLVFLDRAPPVRAAPPPAFGVGATLHAREMETCR